MLVEIRDTTIKLVVPVEVAQTGTTGQIETGVIPEKYIVEEGKPIDPAVYGLAHRYPGDLSNIIGQLRTQAAVLDNGGRGFVNRVADSLNAAIVAIGNSEEL